MSSRMDSRPKWHNPCGYSEDNNSSVPFVDSHGLVPEQELLNQIVSQAAIALERAKNFEKELVDKTFTDVEAIKSQNYDWLPNKKELHKEFGEQIPADYMKTLQMNSALLDTYENLQKIAAGLEQMVWDQEDENGPFLKEFKNAEGFLRNVLCEIQNAIIERNLKRRKDISRDIMPQEQRKMDNTSTNVRNWIIYRDYMNMLEYIIDVFTYFKKNLSS